MRSFPLTWSLIAVASASLVEDPAEFQRRNNNLEVRANAKFCPDVVLAISLLKASSTASAFCSLYLSIPTVTQTVTATSLKQSTFTPSTGTTNIVTSITTTTPSTTTTTSTTSVSTELSLTTVTTTNIVTTTTTGTTTGASTKITYLKRDNPALEQRGLNIPPCLAVFSTGLSAACSCLSLTTRTTTSTATSTVSTTVQAPTKISTTTTSTTTTSTAPTVVNTIIVTTVKTTTTTPDPIIATTTTTETSSTTTTLPRATSTAYIGVACNNPDENFDSGGCNTAGCYCDKRAGSDTIGICVGDPYDCGPQCVTSIDCPDGYACSDSGYTQDTCGRISCVPYYMCTSTYTAPMRMLARGLESSAMKSRNVKKGDEIWVL